MVPKIFVRGGQLIFFGGGRLVKIFVGGDIQMYIQMYVSAVQCSAVLQYSAGQSCSRLVHQKPQQIEKQKKKKNHGNGKKEKTKSVSSQAKISNMLFVKNFFQRLEVYVLQWHRHTNKHTHRGTWQLYDRPGPEGRVGENQYPYCIFRTD